MRQNRRRSRGVGLLVLVLMAVLASVGLGFAAWTEMLTVTGTVNTASVSARWLSNADEFGSIFCSDSEGGDPAAGVAQVSAVRDPGGDQTLVYFTVTNAYPGYSAFCSLSWENNGDVPIATEGHHINGVDAYSGVNFNLDPTSPNDMGDDLWIKYSNGAPSQPPGAGATDKLTITVLNTATPDATLLFTGTHVFVLANP